MLARLVLLTVLCTTACGRHPKFPSFEYQYATCDAQITPSTNVGSQIIALISDWQAKGVSNVTVCFSSGEFDVDKTITIPSGFSIAFVGAGSAGLSNTTLSGGAPGIIFNSANADTISFSQMTITRGWVFVIGGSSNSFFASFTQFLSNGRVFNFFKTNQLTLESCNFTGNGQVDMGAVAVTANFIDISNCVFSGNVATGANPGGCGAGLVVAGSTASSRATIAHTSFDYNQATGGIGAVLATGISLVISSCTFMTNSGGSNRAAWGGALSFSGATLEIFDSQFMDNFATCGGMAVVACASEYFAMYNTTVVGNHGTTRPDCAPGVVNATIIYSGVAPSMKDVAFGQNTINDQPTPDIVSFSCLVYPCS